MSTLTITLHGKTTTDHYDENDSSAVAAMREKFEGIVGNPLRYNTVNGKSETIADFPTGAAQVTVTPQYVGG